MKKLFTLALLSFMIYSAYSQTTIYSANFSSGISSWTPTTNVGGNGRTWKHQANPFTVPSSGGSWTFSSATASNGYAIFVSDSTVNTNHADTASMVSPVINCTGQSFVFLNFDQFFQQAGTATGTVSVSTDNVNWSDVYTTTTTSGVNPEHIIVDLSPYAANQATVYLRFNYVGTWDYWWAVDDIKVIAPAALDIALDAITVPKYIGPGNTAITGTVSNQGGQTITSFDLQYTVNGGSPVTQSFTGLAIGPLSTYNFSFTQLANMGTPMPYAISVTAIGPNGGTDAVLGNNSNAANVAVLSARPDKNALVEEFTTAVCQYCPRGTTTMNTILAAHSNVVGVALHAGFYTDAMTTTDHSTVAAAYTNAAPTGMVDRVLFSGEAQVATDDSRWEPNAVAQTGIIVPVSIIADNNYNSGTRVLNINASAKFYSQIADDFRINAYVVEDSVSGTGSGYNQVNAYNTDNTSPWYNMGNPIVGFKHRHVCRQMMGGAWGDITTIPGTTADGGIYTKNWSVTLPATWVDTRIKIIILVQHGNNANKNDRNILNAMEMNLNGSDSIHVTPYTITGIENPTLVNAVSLSPNPASDHVVVSLSLGDNANVGLEVYNMLGQMVTSKPVQNMSKGDYTSRINTENLTNGVYFVSVKDGNKVIQTLKFVVSK